MTLEEYMFRERYTLREMAEKIGICPNYVFKIKKKYKGAVPSVKVIKKIKKITGGKVTFEDFV
jgi:hypothetical protein